MKKYVVLGGEYQWEYYGEYDSLLDAQAVCMSYEEFWDDIKETRSPRIYLSSQIISIEKSRFGGYNVKFIDIIEIPFLERVDGNWELKTMSY